MKKIVLFLLTAVSLFLVAACDKENNPKKEKTYLDCLIEDYQALVAAYPNAKDHFVEARFVLEDIIADAPASENKLKTMTTICYMWQERGGYSDIFVYDHDFTTGETSMLNYQADSPWLGDILLSGSDLEGLKVSLEEALDRAKKEAGEGDGLNTAYVTLRKPLYPFWPNPQYVVGGLANRHDHVFIDAKDGKVSIEEAVFPEGSAESFFVDDFGVIADEYFGEQRMGYQLDVKWNLAEVRYELNDNVNAKKASDLAPVKATYVFHIPAKDGHPAYLIQAVRNSFQIGTELEFMEEEVSTPWPAEQFIDITAEWIGLTDAIYAVKLGNVNDTDTNQISFYNSGTLGTHVFQFFGNTTPSVYVDAFSGEIIN